MRRKFTGAFFTNFSNRGFTLQEICRNMLTRKTEESLLERGYSRRQLSRIALGAVAAIPFFSEFAFAQQSELVARVRRSGNGGTRQPYDPEVIRISGNENPMGPSPEGIAAMAKVGPLGWRYSPQGENLEFEGLLHTIENVKQGYVNGYAGSSTPLANSVPAFTSPTRSWVMASPGYGSGAAKFVGNKVIKVPLRKDYTHDVEAMIKAAPNAGAFYICNPNNPTGTLTPRKDLDYILANKPKDAVLVIDEAYVHFSGAENYSTELVRQDKDVVVLRTFSKIYGMAGLRAGALYGRPDLLAKVADYGRGGNLPVTATACAAASMKIAATMIPERMTINKKNRELAFEHLDKIGVSYIPSVTNFFMMSVKGMTGKQVGDAMAAKKIQLARSDRWPEWPSHIRVTVGTWEEMTRFNAALSQVIQEGSIKA
ncbi:MAG TPA: aminotransferase class I/II-fold pyridoxal phosphate-dependent enzyme [Bryobacteraceae bacterium]|nr:aminotransferase class I/II-fold pyridoxal phosphate-dependent enzyme [Bryobacteraceae bacterium]